MHASVTAYNNSSYGLANLVQYDARVRLIATGGTVSTTSSSIAVTNANDVVLLFSVASNVKAYNDLTADYVDHLLKQCRRGRRARFYRVAAGANQ